MFRLPFGDRIDPMEEKRQARENTINSLITFCVLCAVIRIGKLLMLNDLFLDQETLNALMENVLPSVGFSVYAVNNIAAMLIGTRRCGR